MEYKNACLKKKSKKEFNKKETSRKQIEGW